jgi:diguanylate cyclase (GGDEF)-like protein
MDFDVFSIFMTPVLIVDRAGNIVFSNDACKEPFGLGRNQLKKSIFPDFLNLEGEFPFDLKTVNEATRYVDINYDTGKGKGSILLALQPLAWVDGQDLVLVSFFDDALERGLLKKYRDEQEATESLATEVFSNQAELLLSRDNFERKVSQMTFLLKFYSQARFILESGALAQQFLQLASDQVGFLYGLFFSISKNSSQVTAKVVSLNERRVGNGLTFLPDAARRDIDVSDVALFKTAEPVTLFTESQLKDCGADAFYQSIGLPKVINAAVMNIKQGEKSTGQFHLLNYMHTQNVDAHAADLLSYMVDPLNLTFENAEFYRTSITDELTQINNVRYFRSRLEAEIETNKRNGGNFALIIFDIDRFKRVNDEYGHLIGDQAIKAVAEQMKVSVRPSDIIARYGGEELVAILPGADEKVAIAVAERIRTRIAQTSIPTNKGSLRLTCSAGIAFFPEDASNSHDLIQNADQALYSAKNTGRDRVVIFQNPNKKLAI